MNSLWNDQDAVRFQGPLGQRVYTSRLLGRDPSLVLHGGGNTSVKLFEPNLFGESEEVLYVKGRGADLSTIVAGKAGLPDRLPEQLGRLDAMPSLQRSGRDVVQISRHRAGVYLVYRLVSRILYSSDIH